MNRQPMLGGNGFAVSRNLDPNLVRVESLKPLGRETRKHPPSQIRKLQASIEQFGFVLPVVIDVDSRVIAGWGLAVAAKRLGLTQVPAVTIADLDEAKLRMLRLALNRLGEDSGWDLDALKLEFSDILEISSEIDLRISGFEMGEIDVAFAGSGNDEEDNLPALNETSTPVTQLGDLWLLGAHRILCTDALMGESYARLLGDERAQMVFTDPPWNIPIAGHVSGLAAIKHPDFAMGCGEMSAAEFEAFLRTALGHAATYSDDGSIHFVCMKGTAPHINNVELGRFGRNRSNVWEYGGQNVLNGTSKSKLSVHPTVKPVALVADAIRDCSHRNGIILDSFGGAGTTLIAAEKTGRRARLIELDPRYVDVTIRRWQNVTGRTAVKADKATACPDNGSRPVRGTSLTIDAETRSDNGAIS